MNIHFSSETSPKEIWASSRDAVLILGQNPKRSVNTQGVVKQPTPENPSTPVSSQGAGTKVIPENPFIAVSLQGAATKVIPENPLIAVSTRNAVELIHSTNLNNITEKFNDRKKNSHEKIKKDSIGITKIHEKIKKDCFAITKTHEKNIKLKKNLKK